MVAEFEEIAHSGGKITFLLRTEGDGRRSIQTQFSSSRPVPLVMTAVYALPQGVPVERINLGGIGQPWNPAPIPGCIPVFIASDSEGKFGHHCPHCGGYWRSGPWPNICPYCATNEQSYQMLSQAQLKYIRHYCNIWENAFEIATDDRVVIDMDVVADAAGQDGEKPSFYVSEQSQQCKFMCEACGEFNDILGRFGFCSTCGTRNDLMIFESQIVPVIREKLNSGNVPEDCLRDAVSSFDSFMGQISEQLVNLIPMTEQRKNRLSKRFYNLEEVRKTFQDWFDIDMCASMKTGEIQFVSKLFLRRHVYEHNGGEVDQKYLDDSGDTSVRLKQHIHESVGDIHTLLNSLVKMVRNIHSKFHEIIRPIPEPIKSYADRNARMEQHE